MPKIVNAICMKILKIKIPFKIYGIIFSSWEFWKVVAGAATPCFKGLIEKRMKIGYAAHF